MVMTPEQVRALQTKVQHYRTSVKGRTPAALSLEVGMLALNLHDDELKIFTKNAAGSIVQLGVAVSDLKSVAFTGSYDSLTEKPVIPPTYVLPTATADILGAIKVGLGLLIDQGVLSAAVQSVRGQEGIAKTGAVEITRDDLGLDILDTTTGKILMQYLPEALTGRISLQGEWNADTNTPPIPLPTADNKGNYYIVSVPGTTDIDGENDWKVQDQIISMGTYWTRIPGPIPGVISVNGMTGTVVLKAGMIPDLATVGLTGKYADLNDIPSEFKPEAHTQSIDTITDAATVAKTGSYNDLVDLPPDPYVRTIGVSVSGAPVMFPVSYIMTHALEFPTNFVGSRAMVELLTGNASEAVIQRGTNGAFSNVGTIRVVGSVTSFKTDLPTAVRFEAGEVLRIEFSNTNIANISISFLGRLVEDQP